jgi:hypothetical protein
MDPIQAGAGIMTRRLVGLDAIRDAAKAAPPAVHVLILDGIPRTGLTVNEVSQITGLPKWRICKEIRDGRIRVITGGQQYVVPVAELATIASWAEYLNTA